MGRETIDIHIKEIKGISSDGSHYLLPRSEQYTLVAKKGDFVYMSATGKMAELVQVVHNEINQDGNYEYILNTSHETRKRFVSESENLLEIGQY